MSCRGVEALLSTPAYAGAVADDAYAVGGQQQIQNVRLLCVSWHTIDADRACIGAAVDAVSEAGGRSTANCMLLCLSRTTLGAKSVL